MIEAIKITLTTRDAALRRPLKPQVIKDSEIPGFRLIVTTRRAFWVQLLQPRGVNPSTNRRWGVVRYELGNARNMDVSAARAASLAAKSAILSGRDPHRERLASRAAATAVRSIVPQTAGEAVALYGKTIASRSHLSEYTRRKIIHYVGKAVRLLGGEGIDLAAIAPNSISLILDALDSSAGERHLVFQALNQFMTWCVKRELIGANPCDGIDRDDRPRPGRSREHTPSIATIRRAWDAVKDAPDHVRGLIRFLLLNPLRREEAQGLLWSEVDLDEKRINIRAERMKGRRPHSLPLSEPAIAILADRALRGNTGRVFASPTGAAICWDHWIKGIRIALGEEHRDRSQRFSLHDIRRSFVSALAESADDGRGFDVDLLDSCLGHSRKGVFGTYQRSSRWREREAAMTAWAKLVVPSAVIIDNVVAIRAR